MRKRNPWSTRITTLIVACSMAAFASSALAVRMTAAFPPGAPSQFVVQPGESTTFAVDFTNLDNGPGVGYAWMYSFLVGLNTQWIIEPLEPASCGFPAQLEGLQIEFPVEFDVTQTLRCTYRVTRAATTYWDGYLMLCTGIQPQSFLGCSTPALIPFGSLPDIGITATPITPPASGSGDVVIRIDVSNAASVPTGAAELFTECRQRNGTDPATILPFQLETGFPGACPAVIMSGCSPEPPLVLSWWKVTIPSIPAQGSMSCLVRLRPRQPFTASIDDHFSLWVGKPHRPVHAIPLVYSGASPGTGMGYDMNSANNIAAFTVAPVAAPSLPVPTAGWRGWLALAVLLTSAGWLAQRQREIVAVTRRSMR